jgi:hypothetical protein
VPDQLNVLLAETPVPVTPSVELSPVETVAGEALANKLETGVQGLVAALTVKLVVAVALQIPVPLALLTVTVYE